MRGRESSCTDGQSVLAGLMLIPRSCLRCIVVMSRLLHGYLFQSHHRIMLTKELVMVLRTSSLRYVLTFDIGGTVALSGLA